MKISKLSFITPNKETLDKKIVLEKIYSQEYQLLNGDQISLSSDIGNRMVQQDCIAIAENSGYTLLLVADGIGGMANGEVASYTTAKIISKWLATEDKEALKIISAKTLEDVLNALMYLISTNIPSYCGSTLNMSIIGPTETLIANVGDSRAYTIKDGKITLRSKDDSAVFKRYNPQTEEERNRLRFHLKNNIITNSISKNTYPTIKVSTIKNEDYDVLCHVTDGVTDYLEEKLISTYIQETNPAKALVENSTKGLPIHNPISSEEFRDYIYPGEDNSTAIVYTKRKVKNN